MFAALLFLALGAVAISSRDGNAPHTQSLAWESSRAPYVAADLKGRRGLGVWSAKEWVGAARKGGGPDPTKGWQTVIVYQEPSKAIAFDFTTDDVEGDRVRVDATQLLPFTYGDLVFDMTSDGDLRVEFRYESGWGEIIYERAIVEPIDVEAEPQYEPAQPGCFSKCQSFLKTCGKLLFGTLVVLMGLVFVVALVFAAKDAASEVGRLFGFGVDAPDGEEYVMVPKATDSWLLNIRIRSPEGEETLFKLEKTTPLQKVFDAYAQRLGVAATSLVFTFDDVTVSGDKTAADIDMDDGDHLDVRAA